MKAIILNGFGDVSHLQQADLSTPVPADNEVLIKSHALSINPVDLKTRTGTSGMAGRLKEENPIILGWDVSGTVTQVGSAVHNFKPGDEVFSMVNFPGHGRAYAEYVVAPADQLAIKPANISHQEAAAATLAALTAYQVLQIAARHLGNAGQTSGASDAQTAAQPLAGKRVLVHAAAGGVGHYAVQIAKDLGAYVIGTSSAANKDFVLGLGADEHFDYRAQPFETSLRDIDFVFDAVGGDTSERSLAVLRKGGQVASILGGVKENVLEKAQTLGVSGFNHLVYSSGKDMEVLANWLSKGILRSHVSAVFPLDQIAAAHTSVESGRTLGKVVVNV